MTSADSKSTGRPAPTAAPAGFAIITDPSLPAELGASENRGALKVETGALVDEGVHEGDLLLIEKGKAEGDGETVVAIVRGQAAVRRFFRQPDGRLRFEAQNARLSPIVAEEAEVEICGKLVALLRKYRDSHP